MTGRGSQLPQLEESLALLDTRRAIRHQATYGGRPKRFQLTRDILALSSLRLQEPLAVASSWTADGKRRR